VSDHEQHLDAWLKRTTETTIGLGRRYAELASFVPATPQPGEGGGGKAVNPTIPIRPDVIDLMQSIREAARRYSDLVRGTLRTGPEWTGPLAGPIVASRLRFVGLTLPRLVTVDPELSEELSIKMWDLARHANSIVVGAPSAPKPFRLDEKCPNCGFASLWFDPRSWRIGCGMPPCGAVFPIDAPVLAASSG
jgi:hypothetical protein